MILTEYFPIARVFFVVPECIPSKKLLLLNHFLRFQLYSIISQLSEALLRWLEVQIFPIGIFGIVRYTVVLLNE